MESYQFLGEHRKVTSANGSGPWRRWYPALGMHTRKNINQFLQREISGQIRLTFPDPFLPPKLCKKFAAKLNHAYLDSSIFT